MRTLVDHLAAPGRLLLAFVPLITGLLLALALFLVLDHVGPMPGDRWALEHWPIYPRRPEPVGGVAHVFGLLGTPRAALVTVVVVAVVVGRSLGVAAVAFVGAGALGVLLSDGLKHALGPTPLFVEAYGSSQGGNFPSGHVVYAVGVAGSLGVLAWDRGRRSAAVLAWALVVLMGAARIVDGSHLASDVVGGYAVGLGWLVTTMRLAGRGPWAERPLLRAAARSPRPTAVPPGGS